MLNIQLVFLPLEERKCWIFLPNTLILWIRHLPANSAMAVLVKVEEESSGEGNWDRKASCNYSPQIVQTNIQIHRLCLILKKSTDLKSHFKYKDKRKMQIQSSYITVLFVVHQIFILISDEVFQIFRYLHNISCIHIFIELVRLSSWDYFWKSIFYFKI